MLGGGAAAGMFGSLLGLGGGVLIVPLLTLGFGLPLREAVGVSLVSVIMTSSAAAGVYLERHVANLRLGMSLELFTAFGALVGGSSRSCWTSGCSPCCSPRLSAYIAFTMIRRRADSGPQPTGGEGEPDGYVVHDMGKGVVGATFAGRHLGPAGRRWRHHQGAADEPDDGCPIAGRDGDEQPHDRDHGGRRRSSTCSAARSIRTSPDRPPSASSWAPPSVPGSPPGSTCATCGPLFVVVLVYTSFEMLLKAIG